MTHCSSTLWSVLRSALCCLLAGSLAFAPAISSAAPSKRRGKKAKKAKVTAPVESDGKTMAIFRFSGGPKSTELREDVKVAFEGKGYTMRTPALDIGEAATKVKCKAEATSDDCLKVVGEWLNSNPKTSADFIVWGSVGTGTAPKADVGVYDIKQGKTATRHKPTFASEDLIIPIALPIAIVTGLENHLDPPPPPTDEEKATIAALDEPEKTPEEIAAEKKEIADAAAAAAEAQQDAVIDTDNIEVDLKKDFDAFCRKDKRRKRKSRDDPKDLRPACKRGPFWGYWQPRAWVALTLTAGSFATMGIFYGLALGARGPYKDAVDELDAYNASVDGDPRRNPDAICNGSQCYDELATEVSRTGAVMRRRAIVGDVLLGTTVLLAGVTAIIIYQDRRDAKEYIKQEKGLRVISNFRAGPILTQDTKGVGLGFSF